MLKYLRNETKFGLPDYRRNSFRHQLADPYQIEPGNQSINQSIELLRRMHMLVHITDTRDYGR
jgi:hypothetical protein